MKLMPFVMLGYPTLKDSKRVLEFLSKRKVIIETALPADNVKGKLAKYHQTALSEGVTEEMVFEVFDDYRPNFLMLRAEPTVKQLNQMDWAFDYAHAPMPCKKVREYNSDYSTRFVSKTTPDKVSYKSVRSSRGFVYLQCARARGGEMYPDQKIYNAMREIRSARFMPIIAGYGVKSAEDAARLAYLKADVIAVGSRSIKVQEGGYKAFEAFWRVFEKAVPRV